jgi:hypothetical protein
MPRHRPTRAERRAGQPVRYTLYLKSILRLLDGLGIALSDCCAGVGRWSWVETLIPADSAVAHSAGSAGAVLEKIPGLQGPIDDCFMTPFLIVLPGGVGGGSSSRGDVEQWAEAEAAHFARRWEGLCRGAPRLKRDFEVTAADRRDFSLVLWGTPETNRCVL